LARLRREKAEAALGQPVKVARAAPQKQLLDEDGNPSIQVGASPQAAEDAARAAYDALLGGRYQEALAGYDRALAVEKDSAAIHLGRATALQKLGRLGEARKAYEKVLALDPSNREALTNMTTLMAAQAPDRALADLRALRKANPGFSPIDAAIGTQEAALGDSAAALEALGRAVAEAPGNGIYRLDLAIVQDRAGLAAEAADSYRAALALLEGGEAGLPLPIDQVRRRLAYLEKR
jgi:tetratricopeptide (TPR) repeat protein